VIPVFAGELDRQKHFAALDKALSGALSAHAVAVEYLAGPAQTLELSTLGRLPAARLVLVGLGPKRGFNDAALRHAVAAGVRSVLDVSQVGVVLPETTKGASLRAV